MSDDIMSVPDMLTGVTADLDQAQATIDEARSIFKDDADFQKQLDEAQFRVDLKRERVKLMRIISDTIYPK